MANKDEHELDKPEEIIVRNDSEAGSPQSADISSGDNVIYVSRDAAGNPVFSNAAGENIFGPGETKEQIGNTLPDDITLHENLSAAERRYDLGQSINTVESGADVIDAMLQARNNRSVDAAEADMADKMREYAALQGKGEAWTEDVDKSSFVTHPQTLHDKTFEEITDAEYESAQVENEMSDAIQEQGGEKPAERFYEISNSGDNWTRVELGKGEHVEKIHGQDASPGVHSPYYATQESLTKDGILKDGELDSEAAKEKLSLPEGNAADSISQREVLNDTFGFRSTVAPSTEISPDGRVIEHAGGGEQTIITDRDNLGAYTQGAESENEVDDSQVGSGESPPLPPDVSDTLSGESSLTASVDESDLEAAEADTKDYGADASVNETSVDTDTSYGLERPPPMPSQADMYGDDWRESGYPKNSFDMVRDFLKEPDPLTQAREAAEKENGTYQWDPEEVSTPEQRMEYYQQVEDRAAEAKDAETQAETADELATEGAEAAESEAASAETEIEEGIPNSESETEAVEPQAASEEELGVETGNVVEPDVETEEPTADAEESISETEPDAQALEPEEAATESEEPISEIEEPVSDAGQPEPEIEEPVTPVEESTEEIDESAAENEADQPVEADEPVGEAEEPAAEVEEPPSQIDEPTTESEEPVSEIEEPVAEVDDPVADAEESTPEVAEPIAEVEEPVVETEEQPPAIEEPATEVEEPVAETEEPTTETEEPVAEIEEPVTEAEESVVDIKEPATESDEPVAEPEDTIVESEEPITEPDEPITETEEPVYEEPIADTDEPVADMEEPVACESEEYSSDEPSAGAESFESGESLESGDSFSSDIDTAPDTSSVDSGSSFSDSSSSLDTDSSSSVSDSGPSMDVSSSGSDVGMD